MHMDFTNPLPAGVRMWLIVLEAALALCLLLFIVWWTMFHNRKRSDDSPGDPPGKSPGSPRGPR
jgi:hypothetical protein